MRFAELRFAGSLQMMIGLIDKFLKTQVVECSAVANWVFSSEMTSEFTKYLNYLKLFFGRMYLALPRLNFYAFSRGYIWDILHLTIRKINRYVLKLQKELNEAREKLDKVGNIF